MLSLTFTANGKRQTAKMKLLPFLFSCVYSGVKLFVFAIKSRRRYSIFVWLIYGLEEKNSKEEAMSSAVNVMITFERLSRGRSGFEIKHDVNGRRHYFCF